MKWMALATLLFAGVFPNRLWADERQAAFPGQTWQIVDPAAAGWSAEGLERARTYAGKIGSTAVMIVQDGKVIAAWGDVRRRIWIRSVRKSVLSALYGVAVTSGKIDLNLNLRQLRIDDRPPCLTPSEKEATVRDLLMARSGVYHTAASETRTMKSRRPERGSHAPGTFWCYNNWDFNVLGTILRTATGEDTFEAVERHIARPIGMEDFRARDGRYKRTTDSEHPAYLMQFTARDLARFGWLYLNNGRWRDRQVVASNWVTQSTRLLSPGRTAADVGYGFLWWVAKDDTQGGVEVGPGSFAAHGVGGQYVVVAPARGIVVVHLVDVKEEGELSRESFYVLLRQIFKAAPRRTRRGEQAS